MWQELIPGLRLNLFMTVLLGIVYPLAITAISQTAFPTQANGTLTRANGRLVGSELIAQRFTKAEYFHARPSAAGEKGYDAASSGGSNLGPTNKKLVDRVAQSVLQFRAENPDYRGPIPADLLTTSGSGLDPHISPDSARAQAARVAKARGMAVEQAYKLVTDSTQAPEFGFLGEPRVNVLLLNLALDGRFPTR